MFSKEVYVARRQQLLKDVKNGLILILGNGDSPFNYPANTYTFRQDSTFRYFFGHDLQNLVGVIDIDNAREYLFGEDVDMEDIIWTGPVPSIHDRALEAGVENSGSIKDLRKLVDDAVFAGRKVHFVPLYRAENVNFIAELLHIDKEYVKAYVSVELIGACVKQRSIKSDIEVAEIEKAIDNAYIMHTTMMKMAAVEGTYEYEIAGKMEGIALAGGGPVSFPIILTTHGEILHGHDHSLQIRKGRMIVSDAGCENPMGYCSDITRSVPVGGKFSSRQKDIYEAVLSAQTLVPTLVKPGVKYSDIHLAAVTRLGSALKELGLIKGNIQDAVNCGTMGLFMPHGLGHMMGLDVHDMENYGENYVGYDKKNIRSTQFGLSSLRLGRELQEGFVITNEPGCYFIPALIDKWRSENKCSDFINYDMLEKYKDFGGIRIEDDLLVTRDGCRLLGKYIPKTVAEIEEQMS
ncbi:MAG TPA: aminopeptidase P family protein [Candidatus Onthomorpha intestinigallinarum]|uniref:Xaa-Pro aminopeptidase n=1 Tax=Candidatus Onthomorpha intestinigallinarum TaxID=2840880 RepID=A0A9D1RI36_9BACT|nr:aminopeptidase P family protein [Candidatus Onthomorpha intestinigallinarum]